LSLNHSRTNTVGICQQIIFSTNISNLKKKLVNRYRLVRASLRHYVMTVIRIFHHFNGTFVSYLGPISTIHIQWFKVSTSYKYYLFIDQQATISFIIIIIVIFTHKHILIKIGINTRVIDIIIYCIKNIIRHRLNTVDNIIFEIEVRKIQINRCFTRKNTAHPYQKRPTAVTFDL